MLLMMPISCYQNKWGRVGYS